ncbi:MAG: type III-B CRISPR module-associated protein Cmr3 [Aquificales bacterium]|nr:type III-B CRISPR module-associated protein Cmr3 [Aquificales bacterium]
MWLFIEATDVWLFRDGRPFDAGSDHRAASIFPPSPTTIQGAIRSKLLSLYDIDFADYAQGKVVRDDVVDQIGAAVNGKQGKMRLRGPFIAKRQDNDDNEIMPYFPTPADILQVNKDENKQKNQKEIHRLLPLKPNAEALFTANWPVDMPQMLPCTYDEALADGEKPEGGMTWISALGMKAYLAGNISTESFAPSKKDREAYGKWVANEEKKLDAAGKLGHVHLKGANYFFSSEYRLGIGIDGKHKRPSDGKLYTATFIRPHKDVGLLVEVTGLVESQWPQTGALSLGGERKSAQYTRIDQPAHWPANTANGNKLIFATPTQFDGGWQTKDWQPHFLEAELTAAIVGRPQLIGGWDMAQNRPKPMRRYVPATAVYFFAAPLQHNNNTEAANGTICDDKDAGRIGFGTTFIGRW